MFRRRGRTEVRRTTQIALAATVMTAVGLSVWSAVDDGDDAARSPTEQSVEVGFVRDMAVHHSQGVAMAETVHRRSNDDELAMVASDIAMGQQSQLGRFYGWLEQWDVPPTGPDSMGWMSHGAESEAMAAPMPMPGLVSRDQLLALTELPVDDADTQFLRLMIAHHRGAITMAEAVLELPVRPEVRRIAEAIVSTQQTEIDALNEMLESRGQEPT